MKIGLAHKRLDLRGGTERDFVRTAEGLRDLGHEVHLFCAQYAFPAPNGIIAHRVPNFTFGRTVGLWSFAMLAPRAIRRHRCDVAVAFCRVLQQDVVRSGGGSHLVFLRKMDQEAGWRNELWHRISIYHRSVLAIEKRQFAADNFKKIITVSNEVKREIGLAYGVPEHKIAVIYNGVDQMRFHPRHRAEKRRIVRQRWGIPAGAPVVLFVGSGFARKGLDRLLSVLGSPRLREVYLLVVGGDSRLAQYRHRVEQEARGRVIFTGPQEDVESYYAAGDLLALPALQEAFGNVVLEALASGVPVLISRAVGAAEILKGEFGKGILFNPDDATEMEAKILEMLAFSRRSSSIDAAVKLASEYSWDHHFRTLEAFLLEVAGRNRRGTIA